MSGSLLTKLDRNGPALVTTVILILALAYVTEAYVASARIHNLIMLVPIAVVIVVLSIIILAREFVFRNRKAGPDATLAGATTAPPAQAGASAGAIAAMMAALIVYAAITPWIGFDLSSILFMAFCLWVQGERRPLVVIGFSVVFGLAITWLLVNGARTPAVTAIIPGL